MDLKIRIINLAKSVVKDDYALDPTQSSDCTGIQFLKLLIDAQGGFYLTVHEKDVEGLIVTFNKYVISFSNVTTYEDGEWQIGDKKYTRKLVLGDTYFIEGGIHSSVLYDEFQVQGSLQRPYIMEEKESLLFRLMDRGARISKVNLAEHTPLIKKTDYTDAYQNVACIVKGCTSERFLNRNEDAYYERHHFIPKKYRDRFETSVDHVSNLIPLCPCHHRMIHLGNKTKRDEIIEAIYSTQIEALKNAGLYIEKEELKELYDQYN